MEENPYKSPLEPSPITRTRDPRQSGWLIWLIPLPISYGGAIGGMLGGIDVGIPAGAALGFAGGWLILVRIRKKEREEILNSTRD